MLDEFYVVESIAENALADINRINIRMKIENGFFMDYFLFS